MLLPLLPALLTVNAGVPPAAATCVFIDEDDGLDAEERATALALLRQAAQVAGHAVSSSAPCTETITASHVAVGGGFSVSVKTSQGARLERVAEVAELAEAYLRLLSPPPETGSTLGEANKAQPVGGGEGGGEAMSKRAWFGFGPGHGHYYARLGYHVSARDDLKGGPSLGIGYRFEADRLILDVSTANLNLWRDGGRGSYQGTWNAYLRLMAFRYLDDLLGHDFFAGAGLSYGEMESRDGYRGDGLQGELGIGYEILRNTLVRSFLQLTVTLPMYKVYDETFVYPSQPTYKSDYAFSAALSIAVGF